MRSRIRGCLAALGTMLAIGAAAVPADAQSITGGGPTGTSPASSSCPAGTVCPPSSPGGTSTTTDGTPLAAATHSAIREQSDTIDASLSDHLLWRLRPIAEAKAPARIGDGGEGVLRGMSAGSPAQTFATWADASASYLKNDTAAFANEGYGVTGLAGLDYAYSDSWLFGVSAGYVRTQLKVKALGGNKIEQGGVLGPYLSYIINEHAAIDGSFTYGRLGNSFAGSSSFDANRYTGAGNLDLFADWNDLKLSGVIGYLYAYESPATSNVPTLINGFPTTQRYGAAKLSVEIADPMGSFEPYLPLAYTYETTHPVDGVGRNTLTLGIGLRYAASDSLRLGIQATDDELRTHSRDAALDVNLRYSF